MARRALANSIAILLVLCESTSSTYDFQACSREKGQIFGQFTFFSAATLSDQVDSCASLCKNYTCSSNSSSSSSSSANNSGGAGTSSSTSQSQSSADCTSLFDQVEDVKVRGIGATCYCLYPEGATSFPFGSDTLPSSSPPNSTGFLACTIPATAAWQPLCAQTSVNSSESCRSACDQVPGSTFSVATFSDSTGCTCSQTNNSAGLQAADRVKITSASTSCSACAPRTKVGICSRVSGWTTMDACRPPGCGSTASASWCADFCDAIDVPGVAEPTISPEYTSCTCGGQLGCYSSNAPCAAPDPAPNIHTCESMHVYSSNDCMNYCEGQTWYNYSSRWTAGACECKLDTYTQCTGCKPDVGQCPISKSTDWCTSLCNEKHLSGTATGSDAGNVKGAYCVCGSEPGCYTPDDDCPLVPADVPPSPEPSQHPAPAPDDEVSCYAFGITSQSSCQEACDVYADAVNTSSQYFPESESEQKLEASCECKHKVLCPLVEEEEDDAGWIIALSIGTLVLSAAALGVPAFLSRTKRHKKTRLATTNAQLQEPLTRGPPPENANAPTNAEDTSALDYDTADDDAHPAAAYVDISEVTTGEFPEHTPGEGQDQDEATAVLAADGLDDAQDSKHADGDTNAATR